MSGVQEGSGVTSIPPIEGVHLWFANPTHVVLADLDPLLLRSERDRQASFHFDKDRRQYLVTRALVRDVLSRYRSVAPHEWNFSRNEYGRPEIDPPCDLRFNLSNHPTMVVCAVAERCELGVDVEPVARGEAIVTIAETVFAPAELADLRALPAERRPDRAVTLWTLKEAYVKARGMGLAIPLSSFAFRFEGHRARIEFDNHLEDRPARWRFVVRDVENHRIAIAAEAPSEPPVRLERWTLPRPAMT